MAGKNYISDELLAQIYAAIRWVRNQTADSPTSPKRQPTPQLFPDLVPVTLALAGGSDGTTSAAPSYTYALTNLAGVQLATGKSPQHNRPKGKTMVGTRGWARLVSGSWELWMSDEAPAFAVCS